MAVTGKVAAIIDDHRVAIKVDSAPSAGNPVKVGQRVWIVSKTVTIPDPDDLSSNLGSFTDYKERLEVTSVYPKYVVATKYVRGMNALAISISGPKELGTLDTDSSGKNAPIINDLDSKIHVGDLAEFEGR